MRRSRADWVAALRGGEYKRGIGRLRGKDSDYCCLGALCELAVKAGVIAPAEQRLTAELTPRSQWHYGDQYMYPPVEVLDWAGLSDRDPQVTATMPDEDFEGETVTVRAHLSELNDDYSDYEFPQIADVIDAQL
jgi:hypothetical protein